MPLSKLEWHLDSQFGTKPGDNFIRLSHLLFKAEQLGSNLVQIHRLLRIEGIHVARDVQVEYQ